ncbi:prefoldin subunit 2-like [Mizuhopecten yessoensis]|uniref:Prefoldin subunit 2 n=1 Tax=Mizuhopecten yessoensis TaxID=6573 RepID=A0A210Q0N7_MIZYE|nr:prefoldin subunit 2-like [Mizuhopecten yessoensis]OWF42310.1 Prefoldin subunit 2 [Mizuhopecten yessoensis]
MAAKGKQSAEQIVAGFQELRQQQRAFATKTSELEMDMKEHELVIETLKEVEDDRKCFRMVGGVLVERTVKDVLPALISNREQMGKIVETLTEKLESKGTEINKYREQHNLKIKGEESKEIEKPDQEVKSGGVLVAKES